MAGIWNHRIARLEAFPSLRFKIRIVETNRQGGVERTHCLLRTVPYSTRHASHFGELSEHRTEANWHVPTGIAAAATHNPIKQKKKKKRKLPREPVTMASKKEKDMRRPDLSKSLETAVGRKELVYVLY